MKVHLDTDLGGDPDDGCALALLLGWPGVDLVAVTSNLDHGGRRAGCAEHVLALAGRSDVDVVAGAPVTLTDGSRHDPTWGDQRYWPDPVVTRPAAPGAAAARLARSIDEGATVVTIGALTNLALLERDRPGLLDGVPIVVMGGWVDPIPAGFPDWGPERDWNLQCDTEAAAIVLASGAELTLVPMPATIGVTLREPDLPRLRAAGPLGALLARQSEMWAVDRDMAALGRDHEALPDDLVNFHWDPVTCAVAVGWTGTERSRTRAHVAVDPAGVLRFEADPAGRLLRHVVGVDADTFTDVWLGCVESLARVR